MNSDIFISHSNQDSTFAIQLAEALREHVLRVFDVTEIEIGEPIAEGLAEALRASKYVVILVSTHTMNSNWAAAELGAALALQKALIPIVIDDVPAEQIPGPIKLRRYLVESDPVRAADQIIRRITRESHPDIQKQPA
ncbi:MAG: toll/interleukin-1 receptor domain-containing protein [Chloroflexi bacterium]|nr:toll/interleukin-1 receptor domain-containing protein [Chloroflexota bacterium]